MSRISPCAFIAAHTRRCKLPEWAVMTLTLLEHHHFNLGMRTRLVSCLRQMMVQHVDGQRWGWPLQQEDFKVYLLVRESSTPLTDINVGGWRMCKTSSMMIIFKYHHRRSLFYKFYCVALKLSLMADYCFYLQQLPLILPICDDYLFFKQFSVTIFLPSLINKKHIRTILIGCFYFFTAQCR